MYKILGRESTLAIIKAYSTVISECREQKYKAAD